MQSSSPDRNLAVKVKKACNGMNETIHMIANDPSLGLYRVQQHVKKSLPKVVDANNELKESKDPLQVIFTDSLNIIC